MNAETIKRILACEPFECGGSAKYVLRKAGPVSATLMAETLYKAVNDKERGTSTEPKCPKFTIRKWTTDLGLGIDSYYIRFEKAPGSQTYSWNAMEGENTGNEYTLTLVAQGKTPS